ncbi:polysaccharide pyruvyl transferase family protein [Selenomonas ruminantium]|uniref:polysaccharide pyruvyl transferase family protein n=1 Tax=Selenomonas ruminantium TaxID=971 RepID=UPI00042336DC|nr:polysaccharide pyruvyl transferase family protein [Selenomonas ruminantium]
MKIGILTYHKSINYGSVLQCWSLQQILKKRGYDVEVIDYHPDKYNEIYDLFVKGQYKRNIKRFFLKKYILKQIDMFKEFREQYIDLSPYKLTINSDFSVLNKYDAIICGSDQIWNVRAFDCDPIYFLPLKIKGKKIAYAVSVNDMSFTEPKCDASLKENILDFDYISVREESGAQKISRFIDGKKNIDVLLDPTLLQSKEEFLKIDSPRLKNEKYIFLYDVWYGKEGIEAAKKISKKLGLPVYTGFMNRDIKSILKVEMAGIHVELENTKPTDFLSLIKYADYIITDSFHGTAFSLIYEKKFVSINKRKDRESMKNDARIMNILSEVNLLDRYITLNQIEKFDFDKDIDYQLISDKRKGLAKNSIDRLCAALEGELRS